MSVNIPEIFGSLVFNDQVMKERLPKDIYDSLHKTIEEGRDLDITLANVVAHAMKEWAIEKGATHYTHWFQPMTGITAEKHDSFINPQSDGRVIMRFSGKELIKGEPDASSFPSGGLRATFEARGYTAWDPTSYAFIKDDSLCIPTVFCSYSGEVLDKKTPLLRSMELINKQSLRILKLLGDKTVKRVVPTVGAEQEYFLVDKQLFEKRKDLVLTGRTLFGAKSPKGQDLEDHYFGAIKPRVMKFMEELNVELWKVGVFAKTEHNETAPAQHELAPVFTTVNIATDQNQLTMEIMKRVADRHGMACILQEKPFEGINGSGKHNNWALSTSDGRNLLDPGKYPQDNETFLLFLCAVIEAVDRHQDLLRISVASAGNDQRLGAHEAPPAIISIFLGDEITGVLEAVEQGVHYERAKSAKMKTGVGVLPDFKKDNTDRNRTSPFAFTGNKFEFRMLGAASSIASPNMMLNTIVASVLDEFAGKIESGKSAMDVIRQSIKEHRRIIFNGNNYSQEWVAEAQKRGLLNLSTSVDAIPLFTTKENIELFTKYAIFSENEIRSRCDIMLNNYCRVRNIEALTMLEMASRDIIPAVVDYCGELARTVSDKQKIGIDITSDAAKKLCDRLTRLCNRLYNKTEQLNAVLNDMNECDDTLKQAKYCKDKVLLAMGELRAVADELETCMSSRHWPYPTYSQLLYSI